MGGGRVVCRLAVVLAFVVGLGWEIPSTTAEPGVARSEAEEVVFPGIEKAQLAVDAAGGLVVAAVPGDARAGLLARYRDPAGDWGPWVRISGVNEQDAEEVQVAAGPRGVAVVAWRAHARGHWRTFAKVRAPDGEWGRTRQLPIDVDWVRNRCGSREGEPQLVAVMNRAGDAAVAVRSEYYRDGEDFTRKLRVFYRSAGGAWAERAEFEDVDYRFVDIDDSGRLYVAFGEYRPRPVSPALVEATGAGRNDAA